MSQKPAEELGADIDVMKALLTAMDGVKYDPNDEPPHGECMFPDPEFTEEELKKLSARTAG